MRYYIWIVILGCYFWQIQAQEQQIMPQKKWSYPAATRSTLVEDYHGTQVADPYRWLENLDTPETKSWVESQNKLTESYFQTIPQREPLKQRLTQLWNFERFSLPVERNGRFFYTRNDGLKNQSVLCMTEGLQGVERELLDPNHLSADGTIAMGSWSVSNNGNYIAYSLSSAGSDWTEWKVLNVQTGTMTTDHLKWVKFSGASWAHDDSGFYYSRFAAPESGTEFTGTNYFQKLYYHKLGTKQEDDTLIYERPDQKEWSFAGYVTDDGRYLLIFVFKGTEPANQVFYKDLQNSSAPVVELISGFEAEYDFIDNDGSMFWFATDKQAPRKKIMGIDLQHPQPEKWKTLIAESEATLRSASCVNNNFILHYMKDAHSQVLVFDLTGKFLHEVALPALGTAGGFGGKRQATETCFAFTNYTNPGEIYRYNIARNEVTSFRKPKVAFSSQDFESQQVFYPSRDGTKIPMTIVHKKGLELNGKNPTVLYGYGGFNISLTPAFSVSNLVWMEQGGVYAVPNLRGGGEYGREWHEAGMRDKKQNVFDDFIAAAEYLIQNKYTCSQKLAIRGGSNGGLLVGAAMTQRPELFRAAIPAVGVMDMLRFHKFTIGWAWATEFGSADSAADFAYLYRYSPLHNLQQGKAYPATLVVTGERDDRVVPAHSFKFAAELQHVQSGEHPALIRIETRAGHGAGKPTTKIIAEAADILSFLHRELSMGNGT
jgi:prolyl oligopeptidase